MKIGPTRKTRVMQVIPDLGLAGAERMVEHLSQELASMGCEVLVVSLYDRHTEIAHELELAGIPVAYLGKKKGFDIQTAIRLRKLVASFKPDVVHSHRHCMQYTVFARVGLKLIEIHTVHNVADREVPRLLQALQKGSFISKRSVPVAINETVRASICDLYNLSEGDVPLVYNGVPRKPCLHVELPGDSNAFSFLNIGRMAPQKNQIVLVKAFAKFHMRHPDSKLVIIGDGELRGSIEFEIDSNNLRNCIFLLGELKNARDYCGACDAFVLPSLYEGMPMTLVEAMMAGAPVLVSDAGGSRDLVADGVSGYLCRPDIDDVSCGMERLYMDQRRSEVAYRGRMRADAYSAYAMATGYMNVYCHMSA